jgi:hypothetical protein
MRICLMNITLIGLALAASACRPDDRDHTVPPRADRGDAPISVNGCLTAGLEQQKVGLTAASAPMASAAVRASGHSAS